ncbi:hypothetical protein GCM10018952_16710 [Streptosporangium vulgare]
MRRRGNDGIVLCEGGGHAYPGGAALDLALLRAACERSGRPVLAGLGADPALAAAAIAAGADGLLLDPAATERDHAGRARGREDRRCPHPQGDPRLGARRP